jgi:tetratricopeptide (TPR) repeat protein
MASQSLDKIEPAGKMLAEFLNIYPTDVTANVMLGRIYARLGQFEDAERLFARAVELAPDLTHVRELYAASLHDQLKWEEEIGQIDILLADDPDNAPLQYLKAQAMMHAGLHGESVQYCEAMVGQRPLDPQSWLAYSNALRAAGRQEACVAALQKSVKLRPGLGEAWWGLANLKTFRFSPSEIDALRAQLARNDLAENARAYMHFAIGKALEDRQATEESFDHYSRGNALVRADHPYDADEITTNVQREKAQFTAGYFRSIEGQGCPSREPIFVVGLPRSGSTLIEQILSRHSAIEGTGELPAVNAMVMQLAARANARRGPGKPESSRPFEGENLDALGEEYLRRTRSSRKLGRPHFVDKMLNNFHHLGLICSMLPNASIIDMRRHPLACGFSNFKQLFPSLAGPSYDLADIGRYYRDYVDLMAHFDHVLPGRVHRVFYEDLIRNPEAEIRRLFEYCNLPFEEATLRFYESGRGVLTASSEQVRRPIYAEAIDQWVPYEQWLGPMKAALGPVLESYPAVPETI